MPTPRTLIGAIGADGQYSRKRTQTLKSKRAASAKAWRTRRKRYGKDGHRANANQSHFLIQQEVLFY